MKARVRDRSDPRERLVVMMQAAETRAGNDAMSGWQAMSGQCRLAGWVVGKSRTQRGMWSFTVVMGHPLRQHRPNMPFIERNQPIETLAPDRPNEAFTVRVLRSGPDHQPQQVQKVSEEGERRSEHVWR